MVGCMFVALLMIQCSGLDAQMDINIHKTVLEFVKHRY